MRVAVAGKGGAGKTTISATLTRLEARAGTSVVAIDADSSPNLGSALGVAPELLGLLQPLPATLVSRRYHTSHSLTISIDDAIRQHAIDAPDGVQLLAVGSPGHAGEGCLCSAHAVVSALLGDLEMYDGLAILDLEASPEHMSRGTAASADVLLLVTEPYFRSLEATRLLARLGGELGIEAMVVANKVRTSTDALVIAAFCAENDLCMIGEVPWSDELRDADGKGAALIDTAPDSDIVRAIRALSLSLHERTSTS